jgi:hypothetical protein
MLPVFENAADIGNRRLAVRQEAHALGEKALAHQVPAKLDPAVHFARMNIE